MFVALLLFALVASSTGLKPEFNSPSQKETLEYGRFQTLTCNVSKGEEPITYKWYNQNLDEITKDFNKPIFAFEYKKGLVLIFNRTSTEHEGSYTCTASNAHGLASKVFLVRVKPPSGLKPEFNSPYQKVTLLYGRFQALRCTASKGEEPITYKWYNQDGDEITKDLNKPIFIFEYKKGSVLIFNRTSTEHEGSYTCSASNAHGLASKVFFVRVPPPSGSKPEFNSPYQIVTLEYFKFQILTCNASEGEKPITYKWYNQDGDEITKDFNKPIFAFEYKNDSALIFNRTRIEHEGPYTCTASNVHGLASKVFFVRVKPPSGLKPKFNSPYQNETLVHGRFQTLTCNASEGEVPITYKWYNQDGDEITGNHYKPIYVFEYEDTLLLVFDTASSEHEGSYTCMASNAHGLARKVFFVTVYPQAMHTEDGSSWTSRNCSMTIEVPTCETSYTIAGLKRRTSYQIEGRAHSRTG